MKKFEKFIVNNTCSIREALLKIENNNKGFLLVLDKDGKIIGTITDGDIRRMFLRGLGSGDTIEIEKDFAKLRKGDDFHAVCSLFKSKKISFLPIVDKLNKLANIITKKQFHVFLLHDKKWSSSYDFFNIDESEIDYEIYNRPWGFYKSTLLSDFAQLKTITIFANEQLSMQKHNRREEHWIVVKGCGRAVVGEEEFDIFPGKYIHIPKFCRHQIINNSNKSIVFSEVQLGEYFGEDDILRYSDKYGRNIILKGE